MQPARKERAPAIVRLERRVKALEEELGSLRPVRVLDEVIALRSLSREKAKEEISALFHEGRTWYYSDIARHLRLDLELVVEICNELLEGQMVINLSHEPKAQAIVAGCVHSPTEGAHPLYSYGAQC